MDSIVDVVLSGKHSDEQLKEFEGKLSEDGKKLFAEAKAFVTKRQDEEGKLNQTTAQKEQAQKDLDAKLAELKKADDDLLRVKGEREATDIQNTQFRQEQLDKAESAFFTEYGITDSAEQAKYKEEFKKQDSGKLDPELIKKDFVKAYAALNADTLIDAKKKQDEMTRNADLDGQNGAGSHDSPPGNRKDPSTFSETAQKLSKEADIPVATADRINREGMTRKIEG